MERNHALKCRGQKKARTWLLGSHARYLKLRSVQCLGRLMDDMKCCMLRSESKGKVPFPPPLFGIAIPKVHDAMPTTAKDVRQMQSYSRTPRSPTMHHTRGLLLANTAQPTSGRSLQMFIPSHTTRWLQTFQGITLWYNA